MQTSVLTRRAVTSSMRARALPRLNLVGGGLRAYAAAPPAGEPELHKTPLYDFHVQNGATMVPFASYSMPLSYTTDGGQIVSHSHVRSACGLFDVSHMVQSLFRGPSSTAFLESLTPSSLKTLPEWTGTLSVLLTEEGGILDDTILTKHAEGEWYVVTNAGRRLEDLAWFEERLEAWNKKEGLIQGKTHMEVLDGWGLIALQGPKSAEVLQTHTSHDLSTLYFGQAAYMDVKGVQCHVARGGYTGEDGFEISIPPASTVDITALLAATEPVRLTGLGPRDSLRLEAGMCLYGHDLDESISPVEAGLSWVIGKDRRAAKDFLGSSRILKELAAPGPSRRRVGFQVTGAPAREGAEIYARGGSEVIGKITSGIPSPTAGGNIAMGYIQNGFHKKGTEVSVMVRKKMRDAVVKAMPFVEAKYYRKPVEAKKD